MSSTHSSNQSSTPVEPPASRPEDASTSAETHSTWQLANIVLRVRDDIDVLVREYGGQPAYIIEDELTSRYYRIGPAEYEFLRQLDGTTTFATALGKTAASLRRQALTHDRAATFCRWLVQTGLASTEQSRTVVRLVEQAEQGERQRKRGRWSVMSQRFPLFYPGRLSETIGRALGWLFSGPSLAIWILLLIAGITAIALDWQRFQSHSETVISPDNHLWLLLTWLGLKLIHESAHSVACHRFGGNVREAGVLFIILMPLPYVDVTSAWRFASKWQRIITSAAGMIAELAIAAIAAVVWSQVGPGLVSQHAVNIIVSAGLMTVLFNANPLMRFDGYYILTDLLELPNLAGHGQQALTNIGRRWGLGLPENEREYPEGRQWLVLTYGIAAFVWRIIICFGLILAADALFFGLGTLLAVAAVGVWWLLPIGRLLRFIVRGNQFEQPSRARFALLVLAVSVTGSSILQFLPWYSSAVAPAVIDYHPLVEIRAPGSGFVAEFDFATGDSVTAGQTLMVLRNDELDTRLNEIELDIDQSQQRAAGYLNSHEIAAYHVEQETLVALRKRHSELCEQHDALTVIAPMDGFIVTPDLTDLPGVHVKGGHLLLRIAPEGHEALLTGDTQLLALVDQTQEDLFRARVGKDLQVHLDGSGTAWTRTRLLDVAPRASRDFPHPALTATAGGPLAVRINSSEGDETDEASVSYELLEPHFLARLSAPQGAFAGQSGRLAFLAQDDSVSSHLMRVVGHWWNLREKAVMRQLYEGR